MSAQNQSASPIPQKIFDIAHGSAATQALLSACELGVFDALHAATVPQSAESLAEQLSSYHDATSRLLDFLVSLELLEKHTNPDGCRLYSNSPSAACLTEASPWGFRHHLLHMHERENIILKNLSSAIREGENQWQRTFNTTSKEVFEVLYANEESLMQFLKHMRGYVKPAAPVFVSALDLSRFKRMCDLGGCTGDVAYAACMAYPHMNITVLDLPSVIDCAPQFRPSMNECPNQQHVTFATGDFFKPNLPAADLYVLTHILHDWGDEKIDTLLSNIFNNLPSGGGILIGEIVLNDDKLGPRAAQYWSLLMLLFCEKGARERSGLEYKQLLEKHGFQDVVIKLTKTNSIDAVLAIKP